MAAVLKSRHPYADRYVRLGNVELVRELWDTIAALPVDDATVNRLYHLTGEVLERWAPEVEHKATELDFEFDKNRDAELQSHAEFVARRRRTRVIYATAREKAAAQWSEVDNA